MIATLLTGAVILILITAALAPLEALGWWAGWRGASDVDDELASDATAGAAEPPAADVDHFMVYLSGIGAMSGTSYPSEELEFLGHLERALPRTALLSDVFPYSVTNMGLTGERLFAGLWRWIERLRIGKPYALVILLLNLRNLYQVATSVDPRYGPIYNVGIASEVRRSLKRHGYRVGSGTPISLLGYSGGGQVAVGIAPFLAQACRAPVWVISLGGVMAADPGLLHVEHLWHLYGTKDPIQASGKLFFAGRWPLMVNSPWNRASAAGKITLLPLGPLTHLGTRSYFDGQTESREGQSCLHTTITTIQAVLSSRGIVPPTSAPTDPAMASE